MWVYCLLHRVVVNGSTIKGFKPQCGLQQGDPLSPYMFILCMEALSGLIGNLEQDKQIKVIKVGRKAPPISHIFFADDAMFFLTIVKSLVRP